MHLQRLRDSKHFGRALIVVIARHRLTSEHRVVNRLFNQIIVSLVVQEVWYCQVMKVAPICSILHLLQRNQQLPQPVNVAKLDRHSKCRHRPEQKNTFGERENRGGVSMHNGIDCCAY
jgi:hypothetical protein